jgi:acyl-CoA dehydrogenase
MLEFTLSPEQIALQQKARAFALKEILPVAWYYDAADDMPLTSAAESLRCRHHEHRHPQKAYGGQGLGLVEAAIMTEELSAACPGLATSIFDNSLGMEPLLLSENEELRQHYLPKILNEYKKICFATSEPADGIRRGRHAV